MSIEPYGYVLNLRFLREVILSKELQNATILILAVIVSHANQNGKTNHFSIERTATSLKITRQAVQNQVRKLVKGGYITSIKVPGRRNEYICNFQHISKLATSSSCTLEEIEATPSDCEYESIDAIPEDCLKATSGVAPLATILDCPEKPIEKKETLRGEEVSTWRIELRKELGDGIYKAWIEDLTWDNVNTLTASTKYRCDWVENHYLKNIRRHLPVKRITFLKVA